MAKLLSGVILNVEMQISTSVEQPVIYHFYVFDFVLCGYINHT